MQSQVGERNSLSPVESNRSMFIRGADHVHRRQSRNKAASSHGRNAHHSDHHDRNCDSARPRYRPRHASTSRILIQCRRRGPCISANFQDENLNIGQFAEVLQGICAEGFRRAVNAVVRQVDTHARPRTLQLRETIRQALQDDDRFEAFLAEEDRAMDEAGFSVAARQLAIRFMRRLREIVALSPDFRLTERARRQ